MKWFISPATNLAWNLGPSLLQNTFLFSSGGCKCPKAGLSEKTSVCVILKSQTWMTAPAPPTYLTLLPLGPQAHFL